MIIVIMITVIMITFITLIIFLTDCHPDHPQVCNEPAAKHVHYGAMTCFSCRAFFR